MINKLKIGILPGCFNPVHNQHISICNQVQQAFMLNKILLVPAYKSVEKKSLITSFHRLNMLKLAIASYDDLCIDDTELIMKKAMYTYQTLFLIIAKYGKQHDYYLILGADQVNKFHLWKKVHLITSLVKIIAVARPDYIFNQSNIVKFNMIQTNINELLVASRSIQSRKNLNLVNPLVLNYINQHGLFVKNWLKMLLTPARFSHSLRVAELAAKLAKHHRLNVRLAWITGLCHDIAKNIPTTELHSCLTKHYTESIHEPPAIWHSLVGAWQLKNLFYFNDSLMLNAVKFHTTAHPSFTKFEKIIFLADKFDQPWSHHIKQLQPLMWQDIDQAFKLVLKWRYNYESRPSKQQLSKLLDSSYKHFIDHD